MQSPPPYSASFVSKPRRVENEQPTGQTSGTRLAHDADLLIRTYISTPTSAFDRERSLPLPICIPQAGVNPREASGFCRGYNDALGNVGISQDVFLNFIDGLNMAITASPPLRVVDLVGKIVGLVPYHWAVIAGIVLNVSAGIGIRVLSKTLTDRYLHAANLNLFKPRGLSVRLCTTPAMFALLGSESKAKPHSKIDRFGRGVGSVLLDLPIPIIQPFASSIIHGIANKPIPISPTGRPGDPINSPTLARRLAMTQGVALPLNVQNLPPPLKPKGVYDKMAAGGIRLNNALERSSEKRLEQRRRALRNIKESGLAPPPNYRPLLHSRSLGSLSSSRPLLNRDHSSSGSLSVRSTASQAFSAFQERRLQKEIIKEQAEQERNRMMPLGQRQKMTSMERKIADADLVESWGTDKILWIVIMPSEKDDELTDVGIVAGPTDEEWTDSRREYEEDGMELDGIMMQELRGPKSNKR
ncbi:hypothetical protein BDP27DRAFT_1326827 [Rhodocollybia butyracea]|uniref:Uncharacterized protein n=1 Tax=Rhodocollybia butyracea TaxID=206335 RepID=A0A9P5PMN7_9AGAR|nr:hypothetical protein BDP27DRAFT_1326827 [Rhodocollybia butyracea]